MKSLVKAPIFLMMKIIGGEEIVMEWSATRLK